MGIMEWWAGLGPDAALLLSIVGLVVVVAWLLLPFGVADLQRKAKRIERHAAELVDLQRAILAELQRGDARPGKRRPPDRGNQVEPKL